MQTVPQERFIGFENYNDIHVHKVKDFIKYFIHLVGFPNYRALSSSSISLYSLLI